MIQQPRRTIPAPLRCMMTAAVTVIVTACGPQSDPAQVPDKTNTAVQAPNARVSSTMPKALRAAYIASAQRSASDSYSATAMNDLVRMENPAQRFVTTVDRNGLVVTPNEDAWHLAMRTTSVGCEGAIVQVTDAAPDVNGNRVQIRHDGLEEWYVNGPLGLEQGFVLHEAPACTGPKVVTIAVEGDLAARLDDSDGDGHGDAVRFVDAAGRETLTYSDLFVTDATGKTIPAWLSVNAGIVSIVVNDAGAAYPVAIDPLIWVQQQKLVAPDGEPDDFFGDSVAIFGDTAIVGSRFDDIGANKDQGSVYVFVRNGTTWIQQAKVTASDGAEGDEFGNSIAIWGDTLLVGADKYDVGTNKNQGAAYVFIRNGTTWTEQAKFVASDGTESAWLGSSVALEGDTAIVGARAENFSRGSAYVFVRNGVTWAEQAKLVASDGLANDLFGVSVSLSGNSAIVGACWDAIAMNSVQGSAYVFVRNGTTWTQQAKLVASDGVGNDAFGVSVALSGDKALVGAWTDDVGTNADQGSAYIFVRNGTMWTEQAKLVASDGGPGEKFGHSVSLKGDTALVGAYFHNGGAFGGGAAYAFLRSGTTWPEQFKLMASDAAPGITFGYSVCLSETTAIIGDYNDFSGQGSAHVFVLGEGSAQSCTIASECANGFCVDGVCCDSACGNGDPTDCQVCSIAAGAMTDGTCAPVAIGMVCRGAAGDCDAAEMCDGVATTCPADAKVDAGTECRSAAGECGIAESCDGVANDCPVDINAVDGTPCMDGTCATGVCMSQGGAGGSGGNAGAGGGTAGSGGSTDDPSCACRTAADPTPISSAALSLLGLALLATRRRAMRN